MLLLVAALTSCAIAEYARPGQSLEPRPDQALVFGAIRFLRDGEYFPWDAFDESAEVRHVRLMGLDRVAASGELWPKADGSLAVYAGEFVSETRTPRPQQGWVPSTTRFGARRVQSEPLSAARADLERRFGTLAAEPVSSP